MAEQCQLYLVVETGSMTSDRLTALVNAVPIAALLIRAPAGRSFDPALAMALVKAAQAHGVAALIADDAHLAHRLRADGVHLRASRDLGTRYSDARDIVGRDAMVGIDAGGSRHVAMELGEAGADYVAFGASRLLAEANDNAGFEPTSTHDLIAWWSEIFEVPCVAIDASDAAEAGAVAAAGADFVAVTIASGLSTAAAIAALRHTACAIRPARGRS